MVLVLAKPRKAPPANRFAQEDMNRRIQGESELGLFRNRKWAEADLHSAFETSRAHCCACQ